STIPHTAYEFFQNSIDSVVRGEIHSFSRFPPMGQRERMRIKEFKTCESTDAPANPDQRLILAEAYFNQIINVFALQALTRTGGDESQVISWLTKTHGDIFQEIPTMQGPTSSLNIDREFNKHSFAGKIDGISFRHRADQIRYL